MSIIFLSENANIRLKDYLRSNDHNLCEIKKTSAVYDAISSHADIYLCKLCEELVISKDQFPFIELQLMDSNVRYSMGSSALGYEYPENIKFNGVQMGKHFIHNTKYTDPILLNIVRHMGLNIIHVQQGYTKCNMVVVNGNSAITSDLGIAKSLQKQKINVQLISPGNVRLSGFPYGFLGGASGKVRNEIIFNGNLSDHPDYAAIIAFINDCGLQVKYFEEYELEDIGSIIEI